MSDRSTVDAGTVGKVSGWCRALRLGALLVAALVLVQAGLAGQMLGARSGLVAVHEVGSHLLFSVTLVLAVVAVIAWRRNQVPAVVGLVGGPMLFLLTTAQAFAGYARLFAVHVPLGVALFGVALSLAWGVSVVGRRVTRP